MYIKSVSELNWLLIVKKKLINSFRKPKINTINVNLTSKNLEMPNNLIM